MNIALAAAAATRLVHMIEYGNMDHILEFDQEYRTLVGALDGEPALLYRMSKDAQLLYVVALLARVTLL